MFWCTEQKTMFKIKQGMVHILAADTPRPREKKKFSAN